MSEDDLCDERAGLGRLEWESRASCQHGRNRTRERSISVRPAMPGPHDALFKTTFGDPLHAAGVLRSALPAEVIALLDLSTLRRVVGSFVDDELAERESDVLFAVDTVGGQTVLVYVLLEHQSTVDSLMPLRALRYEVRIWDAHVAAHGHALPLPPILPIVVSHAEGGWMAATRFEEIVCCATLSRYETSPSARSDSQTQSRTKR